MGDDSVAIRQKSGKPNAAGLPRGEGERRGAREDIGRGCATGGWESRWVKDGRAFPAGFGSVRWVIGSNLRLHGGGRGAGRGLYAFTMQTSTLGGAAGSLFDARLFLEVATAPSEREGQRGGEGGTAPRRPGRARMKDE